MITADDRATTSAITVIPLPAFTDNYLWLIVRGTCAVVVDPGDAAVVRTALEARGLTLVAILITHHHPDHVGGLMALRTAFEVPVYGPRAELEKIPGVTEPLDDGDRIRLPVIALELTVLAVPGHTLGHIAYYADSDDGRDPWLFCGDTLFAAGCGRLFEGSPAQMHQSLSRLAAFPAETVVFCAHEYTLANLDFARTVEPGNEAVAAEIIRVQRLRAHATPSLPSTLRREHATNPFLRCGEPAVVDAARAKAGTDLDDPVAVFATLRRWKDDHKPALR